MFAEHTLFVVGAGASQEVKMPVGSELRNKIRENAYFKESSYGDLILADRVLDRCLRMKFQNSSDLKIRFDALRQVSSGIHLADSIDSFMESHSYNAAITEVGKLSIVHSITSAEANSTLSFDRSNTYNKLDLTSQSLEETWFVRFARILLRGVRPENINNIANGISIICFNYDRCFEYFLIEAISQTMSVSYEAAHTAVYSMNIIHPYGQIGELPNDRFARNSTSGVPFGHRIADGLDPWPIANRIKTYTEQISADSTVKKIRKAVDDARQIVFLGFGFLQQNIDILSPTNSTSHTFNKTIYATGFDVPTQQIQGIHRRIGNMCYGNTNFGAGWENSIHIETGATCSKLFELHGRNFANH